ncbi:MAG: type II secretion system protein [Erysipelotrichaceae bacterium]
MKRFFKKNNKGFTMIELVLTVGIVALIGSVLVQGIVTAKSSTEVTDVQEFMDDFTTQARESFKAEPSKIVGFINGQAIAPTSLPYPYNEMRSISNGTGNPTHFEKYFTADLMDFGSAKNDPTVKYAVEIKLKTDNPADSNSFSFNSSKWAMNIKVSMKKTGTNDAKFDEMYTKKYEFDNVSLANVITKPSDADETKVVRFYANGGEIKNANGGEINHVENSVEVKVDKNTSLSSYVPKVAHKSPKKVSEPIGWSTNPNDSYNLVDLTKVNANSGAMKYYAQYIDKDSYQVTLKLENSEQSFNDNLKPLLKAPYTQFSNGRIGESTDSIGHFLRVSGSEKFFYENNKKAVIQPNKKFKGWKDKEGNTYTYNTSVGKVGNHHLVLMPYMVKGDDVKPENVKAMDIDVTLDLSNETSLFAYENVSYTLEYNKDLDSFNVKASSVNRNNIVSDLGGPKFNTAVVTTYTPDKSKIYFKNDSSKKNLKDAYFKNFDEDKYQKVKITGINLKVVYKGMDLTEFSKNANDSNYVPVKTASSNISIQKKDLMNMFGGEPNLSYSREIVSKEDDMYAAIEDHINGFTDKVMFTTSNSKFSKEKGNSPAPVLNKEMKSYVPYTVNLRDIPTVAFDEQNIGRYWPLNYSYRVVERGNMLYLRLYLGWADPKGTNNYAEKQYIDAIRERSTDPWKSCAKESLRDNCGFWEVLVGNNTVNGVDAYVTTVNTHVNGDHYLQFEEGRESYIGVAPDFVDKSTVNMKDQKTTAELNSRLNISEIETTYNDIDKIKYHGQDTFTSIDPIYFSKGYNSPESKRDVPPASKTVKSGATITAGTGNSKYSFTTNSNVSILPTWLKN